jgi:hypothetical protein
VLRAARLNRPWTRSDEGNTQLAIESCASLGAAAKKAGCGELATFLRQHHKRASASWLAFEQACATLDGAEERYREILARLDDAAVRVGLGTLSAEDAVANATELTVATAADVFLARQLLDAQRAAHRHLRAAGAAYDSGRQQAESSVQGLLAHVQRDGHRRGQPPSESDMSPAALRWLPYYQSLALDECDDDEQRAALVELFERRRRMRGLEVDRARSELARLEAQAAQ